MKRSLVAVNGKMKIKMEKQIGDLVNGIIRHFAIIVIVNEIESAKGVVMDQILEYTIAMMMVRPIEVAITE